MRICGESYSRHAAFMQEAARKREYTGTPRPAPFDIALMPPFLSIRSRDRREHAGSEMAPQVYRRRYINARKTSPHIL